MKVLDPGHFYELHCLDTDKDQFFKPFETLRFVKRMGDHYPGNDTCYSGTTIQEVLRALIDRLAYVDNQIQCSEDTEALLHLHHALWLMEMRAARVHGRTLKALPHQVKSSPICLECGHIECEGHPHD